MENKRKNTIFSYFQNKIKSNEVYCEDIINTDNIKVE